MCHKIPELNRPPFAAHAEGFFEAAFEKFDQSVTREDVQTLVKMRDEIMHTGALKVTDRTAHDARLQYRSRAKDGYRKLVEITARAIIATLDLTYVPSIVGVPWQTASEDSPE